MVSWSPAASDEVRASALLTVGLRSESALCESPFGRAGDVGFVLFSELEEVEKRGSFSFYIEVSLIQK